MEALVGHTTAPFFCLNENRHNCCACIEADRFDPKALVAAIQQRLGIAAAPATPVALAPAAAASATETTGDDQSGQSARVYNIATTQPSKPKAPSVHPKAQAKAAG